MEVLLDGAMKILIGEVKRGMSSADALRATQSILNLAHAKITLADVRNVANRN